MVITFSSKIAENVFESLQERDIREIGNMYLVFLDADAAWREYQANAHTRYWCARRILKLKLRPFFGEHTFRSEFIDEIGRACLSWQDKN